MPLIQVRVIKDVFNKDQKRQIINKLTDAMVSVEGENMRGVTWVTIEEVDSGDWGIGGKALTTSDVHALAAGRADRPAARRWPLRVDRRRAPLARAQVAAMRGTAVTPPCVLPRSACG